MHTMKPCMHYFSALQLLFCLDWLQLTGLQLPLVGTYSLWFNSFGYSHCFNWLVICLIKGESTQAPEENSLKFHHVIVTHSPLMSWAK